MRRENQTDRQKDRKTERQKTEKQKDRKTEKQKVRNTIFNTYQFIYSKVETNFKEMQEVKVEKRKMCQK